MAKKLKVKALRDIIIGKTEVWGKGTIKEMSPREISIKRMVERKLIEIIE